MSPNEGLMAMPVAMACRALREQRRLCLRYGGRERLIEVHVVGRSRDGRNLMRVWQVRGGSTSGAPVGWKMLHLDEVRSGHVTHERSLAPRPGYKRNDPIMAADIICQL